MRFYDGPSIHLNIQAADRDCSAQPGAGEPDSGLLTRIIDSDLNQVLMLYMIERDSVVTTPSQRKC